MFRFVVALLVVVRDISKFIRGLMRMVGLEALSLVSYLGWILET
jgi:hypothetical protein